jgi:hypothetical protein
MFDDLKAAFEWARKEYPGCSFSVKQQTDGPTIVSVKGQDGTTRTVVYVKKGAKSIGEGKAL